MFYLLIILILIAIIIGISYYVFRQTFLAPPHLDAKHYYVPDFEQFDAVHEGIRESIGRMAARPYESITITSFIAMEHNMNRCIICYMIISGK